MTDRKFLWWQELPYTEVCRWAKEECDLAILPIGAIEQHGTCVRHRRASERYQHLAGDAKLVPPGGHQDSRTAHRERDPEVPGELVEDAEVASTDERHQRVPSRNAMSGSAETSGASDDRTSFANLLHLIRPLWAFLLYDIIAMALKVVGVQPPGLWLEAACIAFAAALFWQTLTERSRGAQFARQDLVDFRKVLAANSLSWIGVQTMFVYMIAFVQQRFPELGADASGRMLSTSFLALNAVAAALPALVLLPLARTFDVVKVHSACLGIMAAGFAGVYLFAHSPASLYLLMALMGIGWAAIVSLPFSIMSQRVDPSRIGLYMGVFNLSIVLPQLVVSLGVGTFVSRSADKGVIFLIGAVSLALAALAWRSVSGDGPGLRETAGGASPSTSH